MSVKVGSYWLQLLLLCCRQQPLVPEKLIGMVQAPVVSKLGSARVTATSAFRLPRISHSPALALVLWLIVTGTPGITIPKTMSESCATASAVLEIWAATPDDPLACASARAGNHARTTSAAIRAGASGPNLIGRAL